MAGLEYLAQPRAQVVPLASTKTGFRLSSLTGLRFFAALIVLATHSLIDYTRVPLIGALGMLGSVGVVFFFVLSGFVLTWSAPDKMSIWTFYRNRAARVYPLYVLTGVVAMIALSSRGTSIELSKVGAYVLMVQCWVPSIGYAYAFNAPAWSLSCEAFFYLCFPALLLALRKLSTRQLYAIGLAIWVGMLAAGLAASRWQSSVVSPLLGVNPAYRMGEFVIGIVMGLSLARGQRWRVSPLVPGALVLLECGLIVAAGRWARYSGHEGVVGSSLINSVLAPPLVALICASAAADIVGRPSVFRHPYLVRLGEWSFALYLCHQLLIDEVARVEWLVPKSLAERVGAEIAVCLVAIAIAWIVHTTWEKPIERLLRGGSAGRGRTRPGPNARGGASDGLTTPSQ